MLRDEDPSRRGAMVSEHAKVIECSCGAVITGSSDDDVVTKAQDHAKETHDMELTREQALSMARPA
jgi:predicted small metal-binding protein